MIDGNQIQEFMPYIQGVIGGATSVGLFKGPINTVQDLWYIYFGHKVSEKAEMLKARKEYNVEKLKSEMLNEISTIPPENVQEPKLKIIGPALEASRFYIEEDEIRKMFAKIIASSIDDRKNPIMHSSFIEIIKQLDVLDAKLLNFFKQNHYGAQTCIQTLRVIRNINNGKVPLIPIFYISGEFQDFQQNAASLINLERLGLIKIYNDTWFPDDDMYDALKNHPTIVHVLSHNSETETVNSCFTLTNFGQNFIDVCVL